MTTHFYRLMFIVVAALTSMIGCGEKTESDHDGAPDQVDTNNDVEVVFGNDTDSDDFLPDSDPTPLELTEKWAIHWGFEDSPGGDRATTVIASADGSLLVAGENSEVSIDEPASTEGGFFLTKVNSDGTIAWSSLSADILNAHEGHSVAVDAAGNCLAAGYNNDQIQIVKFDKNGEKVWAQEYGSDARDWADAIAVDTAGNGYIAGTTRGALYGNTYGGGNDPFLMKISADSEIVWVRQWNDDKQDQAHAVALDGDNAVYVVGRTEDNADPDGGGDRSKAFLIKFTPDGDEIWSRNWGVTEMWNIGYAVAVDKTGSVFVSGITSGAFANNTSAGDADTFIAMFDADGAMEWVRQFGTDGWDSNYTVAVDDKGHVFAGGEVSYGTFCQENACMYSFILAAYDYEGNRLYFKQWKDIGDLNGINSIATGSDGDIFLAGRATNNGNTPDPSWGGSVFLTRFTVE